MARISVPPIHDPVLLLIALIGGQQFFPGESSGFPTA
jgi:hypothetical protein